ncbi:hypothetical protein [Phyllobacterium sp. SB3]|uniref:hypothetical protein n=1 Tax=Phyllobacterium sp. SB3 TaxID=3156073 RepID=UPI0032AF69E3
MKHVPIAKGVARRKSGISRLLVTSTNLAADHSLEPALSTDWTKLSNILKRSGGGFSHTRKPAG